MRTWQRRLWKGFAAAFAAVVILFATLVGVFRLLAPLVPSYRTQVEKWAAQALNRPVNIGGMGARWDWYGPEITLKDVKLYSHDGKYVVITAHEIRLGVTMHALLHGNFSTPSRIILMSPHASVVRETGGRYYVRGFGGESGQVQQVDWHGALDDAFKQSAEIIVRDGTLVLLDMRRHTTPFVFSAIDIKLDNAADSHSVSGNLQLPQAFGQKLAFDASVEGEGLHPEAWRWRISFNGESLNVPAVFSYWPQYQNRFAGGSLDLHAEAEGDHASLGYLKMQVSGHDLLPAGETTPGFTTLAGNVVWSRTGSGWTLNGTGIRLAYEGQSWPESTFELVHSADAQGYTWQGSASYLRMQDIDTLISWLPPALHGKLQNIEKLAPQGEVNDLKVAGHWQGNSLQAWSVNGRFQDLGIKSDGDLPGFTGMDGRIALDQTGGTLQLDTRNGSVTFSGLFRGPLYATALDADFKFVHDANGWLISSDDIQVNNADASATGKGSFLFPADGSSPRLDLDASVKNANARNKSAYFPVGIMPKEVVDWLDNAIVSGQVPEGTLSVHGLLKDFPYDHGQGLFDIKFHLVNGVLDYSPGWPKLRHLDADVEFLNQGLSAKLRSGTILGDDVVQGATAGFADLREGVLRIDGGARGPAQSSFDFLRTGPLKERFGAFLSPVKVSGRSDISLSLVLPVTDVNAFKLDGNAHLTDVGIAVQGAPGWALDKLHGDLHFTGTGLSAEQVQGSMLGAPVSINLRPGSGENADMTIVDARGGVEGATLMAASGLQVKDAIQGQAGWEMHGLIPNNPAAKTAGLSLELHSDLQGLAVNLPEPLAKTAESSLPLKMEFQIKDHGNVQLGMQYAERGAAKLQFSAGDGKWKFDRGIVDIGSTQTEMPDTPGLSVSGKLENLDTSQWRLHAGNDDQGQGSYSPDLPAYLQHVDLRIEHFSGFGQTINGLHLLLDRNPDNWRLALASAAIDGRIDLPFSVDAQHPIVADMDHVMIERNGPQPENTSSSSQTSYDPRRIPAVRFSSKLLQFSGVSLTQVRAVLMPRPDGVNLADLSVDGRTFKAGVNGSWTVEPDNTQRSHLSANITSTDIESTLKAFGYAPGITGKDAVLQAEVNWNGGPFGSILPTLSGNLHLKLANGQLLEVQPGAGRVFGLLSINALPRRLLLNFSDVFGTGFAYDTIEGNFDLQNGDAYTKDMTISGPAAKIHVLGRIGLASKDFDEALIVDASVGSSLPIIGALAGGVGVGAAVWLLTEVFKKPLKSVGEVRYRLTGTWDNPKLVKVAESPQKKATNPAPEPQATHQ